MGKKEGENDDGADAKPAPKKAAKCERVQFSTTFYERGAVKYKAGAHYPQTAETLSQVAAGHAKVATVEMDAEQHETETATAVEKLRAQHKATHEAEKIARASGELKD